MSTIARPNFVAKKNRFVRSHLTKGVIGGEKRVVARHRILRESGGLFTDLCGEKLTWLYLLLGLINSLRT